jgi:hypothetical protein
MVLLLLGDNEVGLKSPPNFGPAQVAAGARKPPIQRHHLSGASVTAIPAPSRGQASHDDGRAGSYVVGKLEARA